MDFEAFHAPDRYRLYAMAIENAELLGDNNLKEEYEALRETVRSAYEADYRATERANEREGVTEEAEE